MMQPQILLLKEGTDSTQGKSQLISNINACQSVSDAVKSTLGPRGMDKLIVNKNGKTTISNDGATIMKLLEIVHPAAKSLVDIAKSQDAEVGDGTTSVVLLAAEFLKQVKSYVEEGVHPRVLVKAVREAGQLAFDKINELSVKINKSNADEFRSLLEKCASTAMSSKLIHLQRNFFSKMVVDAVLMLDEHLPMDMIGIKKVQGGALEESLLVAGVAFKKTFSYAGFEMQPKIYHDCKIAMLNIELELKAERDNAEIRIDNVQEYQKIVDAEWKILYNKLAKIHESGANVVLSNLPIGDVATQYFADRDMFCAGRVPVEDLKRTIKACGGAIMTTVNDLNDAVLGKCELFEERQIGSERFNFFKGCPNAKTCTLILRGGAEQFLEETERSLHDAIMIVRRTIQNDAVVAGGGAIEMEISRILREHSRSIAGKKQLIIAAIAKALEVIPRQLCDNAGFDATNILNKLRQKHAQGNCWYGVDILKEDISDNMVNCVWEPAVVKINAITAAIEATCLILLVDETIQNQKSGDGQPPMGRGMGRPMYIGTFGTSRNNTVESQKPIENSSETINTDDSTKLQIDTNKLTKELAELNEKNKDLLDKYKRALAEGENVRQRFMKQASEAKLFGIQGFCKDLLDVADILNKATETVPKEEISDQNPHLKNLYEGLVMTEAKLQSVFKRHGLESVTPLNQKFDPNFHEALFQQEIEGKESGTVISVTKIGYKLHDRVIRPALVGVAK